MPLAQGAPARRGSSTCGRARTAQSGGMRSVKAHVRRSMRERPARGACRSRACAQGPVHRGTGSNTTHADEPSAVLLGSLTCAGQSATSWHTMGCTCTDESSARTCERRPVHWSCASSLNHSVEAIDTPIIVHTRPKFRDQPALPSSWKSCERDGWPAGHARGPGARALAQGSAWDVQGSSLPARRLADQENPTLPCANAEPCRSAQTT